MTDSISSGNRDNRRKHRSKRNKKSNKQSQKKPKQVLRLYMTNNRHQNSNRNHQRNDQLTSLLNTQNLSQVRSAKQRKENQNNSSQAIHIPNTLLRTPAQAVLSLRQLEPLRHQHPESKLNQSHKAKDRDHNHIRLVSKQVLHRLVRAFARFFVRHIENNDNKCYKCDNRADWQLLS